MNEPNMPKPLVAHVEIFSLFIVAGVLVTTLIGLTWIGLVLPKRSVQYIFLIFPMGLGTLLGPSLYRGFKSFYKYSNFASKPIPYIGLDKRTLTLLGTKIDWKNIRSIKLVTLSGRRPIRFLMVQTVGDVSEFGFSPDAFDRLTRSNELVIERLSLPYNEKSRVLLTLVVGNLTVAPTEIERAAQGFLQAVKNALE